MGKNELSKHTKKKDLPIYKLESPDIVTVLKEMITAKREYEITKETEHTKRNEITANLMIHMKKMSDQRDMFSEALQMEYHMRHETIDRMFVYLERAYFDGNTEVVVQSMKSIEGIIKNSPLKELLAIGKLLEDDGDLII